MLVEMIDYLRARLRAVILCCYVGIGAIVVWSLTLGSAHAETSIEKIPVFWGIFGFLSSLAIIYFALWLGKAGIKTGEDYYDK